MGNLSAGKGGNQMRPFPGQGISPASFLPLLGTGGKGMGPGFSQMPYYPGGMNPSDFMYVR